MEENFHSWKPPFDDDESIARAKAKVLSRIEAKTRYTFSFKKRIKLAAAVLVLVVMGAMAYILNNVEITNAHNEVEIVVLPDDSKVTLAHGAVISYNKIGWRWKKSVTFEGMGHFNITPGKNFTVQLPDAKIKVLGTSFTVWTNIKSSFIHCTEGIIKVMRDKDEVTLHPYEFTTISNNRISPKEIYSTSQFLLPRNERTLTYTSVPLSIVLRELEVQMNIHIENHLPKGLKYTGTIDAYDVKTCFEVLCKPFGATFEIMPNGDVWIFPQ